MARKSRWALIIALVFAHGVTAGTYAGEQEQPSSSAGISADEALRVDAVAYANMFGTTVDEAFRRLQIIPAVRLHVTQTVGKHPDRFAGAWFQHSPDLRVFLRLKGTDSADAIVDELSELEVPIDVILAAPHSLLELLAAQEHVVDQLARDHPELGVGIDVTDGSIELNGPTPLSPAEVTSLSSATGVPVRQETTTAVRPMHTYGGHEIRNSRGRCTTGFSVQDAVSGRSGILTAGHCEGTIFFGTNPTYVENANSNYPATLGGVRWDSNQDFAWYETSHAELASFWDGTQHRGVVGTQPRLEMVNEFVCHYGIKTGHSCGTVTDIHYVPAPDVCGGQACQAVWAKVDNHGPLLCDIGDSGGPFFVGGVAWGTLTSAATVGSGYGDCAFAIMMTIGALKWDGVNTRVKLVGGGLG